MEQGHSIILKGLGFEVCVLGLGCFNFDVLTFFLLNFGFRFASKLWERKAGVNGFGVEGLVLGAER